MTRSTCLYLELPLTDYREAWELQRKIVTAKISRSLSRDVILVLEHPPVYTLGRRGGIENLCVSKAFLERKGIAVVPVERGGDITYHGPGQLVAYPLLDIQRTRLGVTDLVGRLEDVMIHTAAAVGISAGRNPLNRGVWIDNAKLGSIGIAIRKGVTFHGMALNVNLDLTPFSWINPCGLQGVAMTSLEKEAGRAVDMQEARQAGIANLAGALDMHLERVELETVMRSLDLSGVDTADGPKL